MSGPYRQMIYPEMLQCYTVLNAIDRPQLFIQNDLLATNDYLSNQK